MAQFEGGLTSAVNSQTDRVGREATAAHLRQLVETEQRALQIANEDRQRQMAARSNAGSILPALLQAMQGGAGGPPMGMPPPDILSALQQQSMPQGPPPQPPMPGQGSVPMAMPPPGVPPPQQSMPPPGAPAPQGTPSPMESPAPEAAAPPPPVGWQTSPGAPPQLGGPEPTPENVAQAEIPGAGLPPPTPKIPPQLLSVPMVIKAMQERNLPPEQMIDTLGQMMPIIEKDNRLAFAQLKAETEAEKAANSAYRLVIDRFKAETGRADVNSKIDRRAVSGKQSVRQNDIRERALETRLASANAKAAAGGSEPEGLTPGGLAVATGLARAGLPMPGGWSKSGIARGNAILNAMAENQEGGAGSGSIAEGRGTFKADQASMQQRQRQVDALEAASKKIEKDIDTMTSVMDKGVAGSVTLVNKPLNVLRREFSDPALTKYALAVKQVGVEYERMINGGLLSVAQLHEGAREDAAKIINENMTPDQVKAVIPIMLQEIANQRNAHHEQLDEIKERMRTTAKRPAGGAAAPATASGGGTAPRINVTADQTPEGKAAMQADITLKNQVEGAGIKYEPEKYDYRVSGGKVQRKPK